jgi:hypothetical protein
MSESRPSVRPYSALGMRPQSALGYRSIQRSESPVPRGNVKVVVRVRPPVEREVQKNGRNLIQMEGNTTTITPSCNGCPPSRNMEPRQFHFDYSFWSVDETDVNYADQNTVYDAVGKEFLDHNMEGYHTCIFAYGQTGAGKSYTMMGSESDPGLIPRTCNDLFERIDKLLESNVSCTVRLSYFEIYNEQVRDLVAPPNKKESTARLRVRESPVDGPYVEGLSEYVVKNAAQVLKYLSLGNKARATAATKMNNQSSRSHAVFTLVVRQVHFHSDTDTTEEKVSQIRLVDLAGSERATASGATGTRLREGSNINKSLTTLGRVIAALSVPSSSKPLVPYRDSALTWLLKESLGGNSKTAMMACISPTDYEETLSTLRYADQAKRIRTRAIINQDIVSGADRDKLVEEMQQQINSLQLSLHKQEEDDQFKQQLIKVNKAIRFYEDRAINEEHKRRALQAQNAAMMRHNRLLTTHLKEITYKNGLMAESLGTANYDSLKDEHSQLLADFSVFRRELRETRTKWTNKLKEIGVSC